MKDKFIIECHYETWSNTGKKWSNWFVMKNEPMTEEDANNHIKEIKNTFSFIDQKTKLKHEYRLKSCKEHEKEMKELFKQIEENTKKQEEYYKSDAYKELQRKKRQSAKELKERQKKYKEEHGIEQ